MTTYRVSLIYRADGMLRPLSHRTITRADTGAQAVDIAVSGLSSAYESGFNVLTWTVERLEMRARGSAQTRPVKKRRPLSGTETAQSVVWLGSQDTSGGES